MTDDLIDTWTPKHRITDPAEALAALERAVPDMADHRRPTPAVLDWALLEEGLGTALPSDYKHLAEWYPAFAIGHCVLLGLPEPGAEHHVLRDIRSLLEALVEARPEPGPGVPPHPAPGGLLPWAESDESDTFAWRTTGGTPQEWCVTVAGHGGGWWHYEGGAVQFLAELCDGTLEPPDLRLFDSEVTPC